MERRKYETVDKNTAEGGEGPEIGIAGCLVTSGSPRPVCVLSISLCGRREQGSRGKRDGLKSKLLGSG